MVEPACIPNPNWLRPGITGAGQQAFGDQLLARHRFVLLQGAISPHSWNLILVAMAATGSYSIRSRKAFALATRLHPPATRRGT